MARKKREPPPEAADSNSREFEHNLAMEIAKAIFSNNFDLIKNTSQMLQAVTTLFLTAYVAFVLQATSLLRSSSALDVFVVSLPIVAWASSLIVAFVLVIIHLHKGEDFTVGELDSTVAAYERIINKRKRLIVAPAWVTAAGMLAFGVALLFVFLPAMKR